MPSFSYNCIELIIKAVGIKKYYQMNHERFMHEYETKWKKASGNPPKSFNKKFDVTEIKEESCRYFRITPQNATKRIVLFIHGGGYVMEIDQIHWSAVKKIALQTNSTVIVPIYPLMPEHNCQEAFHMIGEVYQNILQKAKSDDVVMVGDSAGAQIVLSFCQELLKKGISQPRRMVLLSPPLDFAPSDELWKKYREIDKIDPMISINIINFVEKYWVGNTPMKNYHISPINGDFKGFPPIDVFFGTKEFLYACADQLKNKAEENQVAINLHIGEGMMHVWPYFMVSKESKAAMSEIINIIQQ